jgi:hypothetical protein
MKPLILMEKKFAHYFVEQQLVFRLHKSVVELQHTHERQQEADPLLLPG